MNKNNYIILSGAMGAGKTSVMKKLRDSDHTCVDEPARQILAEQRKIAGNGLPEKDPRLFTELMLSRTIFQYKLHENFSGPVFFDRAMPDFIAYSNLFNVNEKVFRNAAEEYRFNKTIFFFKGIESIYTTDDERKMSFEQADGFGNRVREIYQELGYEIQEVPFLDFGSRAEFILNKIKEN